MMAHKRVGMLDLTARADLAAPKASCAVKAYRTAWKPQTPPTPINARRASRKGKEGRTVTPPTLRPPGVASYAERRDHRQQRDPPADAAIAGGRWVQLALARRWSAGGSSRPARGPVSPQAIGAKAIDARSNR